MTVHIKYAKIRLDVFHSTSSHSHRLSLPPRPHIHVSPLPHNFPNLLNHLSQSRNTLIIPDLMSFVRNLHLSDMR